MTATVASSGAPRNCTMNISLPEELKMFVDSQTTRGGYGSTSEFVRELIRREQDRQQLRGLLLAGAASPVNRVVDDSLFSELRAELDSDR